MLQIRLIFDLYTCAGSKFRDCVGWGVGHRMSCPQQAALHRPHTNKHVVTNKADNTDAVRRAVHEV